jgi:hypothetical protein
VISIHINHHQGTLKGLKGVGGGAIQITNVFVWTEWKREATRFQISDENSIFPHYSKKTSHI